MSSELVTANPNGAALVEAALIQGDLAKLSSEERVAYYRAVCRSLGLNELTKPFEYITLNNKLTLYAKRDATDQLRRINNVSVTIVSRERLEGVYVVTARATLPDGRTDESIGAVTIENLKGDALANGLMKAETKAKRRVTLSICGLGYLDETETETIPTARPARVDTATGEIVEPLVADLVGAPSVISGQMFRRLASAAKLLGWDEARLNAESEARWKNPARRLSVEEGDLLIEELELALQTAQP